MSLFAELFNEMLMRDFGFEIYKCLVRAPDKVKEDKVRYETTGQRQSGVNMLCIAMYGNRNSHSCLFHALSINYRFRFI